MLIFPQEIGPGPLEMLGDGPHRRLDIPATEAVVEFAVLAVVAGDPLGGEGRVPAQVPLANGRARG